MIKLINPGGRLLVGLSAGADSVALLHLLLDAGCSVCAVHVNHALRGEASDADEAFAVRLCQSQQVPLWTFRAVPPEHPSEGWAREVRYVFFRQAMAQSGADALVLAHHRDDQAETLLLHLLRGAGLNGLTGMAAESKLEGMRILRPLLPYGRDELRAYLIEHNIPWREDGSNEDPRFLRNALRLQVLPMLEALAPGAAARMANTALLLTQDEAVLDGMAAEFLANHPGGALPLTALRAQQPGMQRRILRAWWAAHAPVQAERSLSAAQTEALLALVDAPASTTCNLPGGWHGQSGWSHLHLVAPDASAAITPMPASACDLFTVEAFAGKTGDGRQAQVIPREWLNECTVRSRCRGDFIRPFGMDGSQSLQDYLVNRRIDAAFRDHVPLLCRGSEVLLAGGVGAGDLPRAEQMKDPVLLRWKESFPWRRDALK